MAAGVVPSASERIECFGMSWFGKELNVGNAAEMIPDFDDNDDDDDDDGDDDDDDNCNVGWSNYCCAP